MKLFKIITAATLIVFFASCCSCRSGSKSAVALTGTKWQVVQLEGANFAPSADSFTLNFTDNGNVNGRGDCNQLNGAYTTGANGKISFERMIATRAFCPDQASEDRFVSILNNADRYSIDGDMLMIFNGNEMKMMLQAK